MHASYETTRVGWISMCSRSCNPAQPQEEITEIDCQASSIKTVTIWVKVMDPHILHGVWCSDKTVRTKLQHKNFESTCEHLLSGFRGPCPDDPSKTIQWNVAIVYWAAYRIRPPIPSSRNPLDNGSWPTTRPGNHQSKPPPYHGKRQPSYRSILSQAARKRRKSP